MGFIRLLYFTLSLLSILNGNTDISVLKKSALDGDINSQVILAIKYNTGSEVTKDYEKAFYWFSTAANSDISELNEIELTPLSSAYYGLADFYRKGNYVNKDLTKAVHYYEKAAELEHDSAQYNLGVLYASGEHLPPNFILAYKWIKIALTNNIKVAESEYYQNSLNKVSNILTKDELSRAEELFHTWCSKYRDSEIDTTELDEFKKIIFTEIMPVNGYLSKERHTQFWEIINNLDIDQNKRESLLTYFKEAISRGQKLQKALWKCILISYKNQTVHLSNEYIKLLESYSNFDNWAEEYNLTPGTEEYLNFKNSFNASMGKTTKNQRLFLEAAARRDSTITQGDKYFQLDENSIENVLGNLNSSFDRLERLFTEEWIMK